MPDNVISNTSPIFYLSQIGQLELLKKLYTHMIVPEGVHEELKKGQKIGYDIPDVKQIPFIQIKTVENKTAMPLISDLDQGEKETLILSLELSNPLVLLDDKMGRKVAQLKNIKKTGTLGILVRAKQEKYIPSIKPLLDKLIKNEFYVDSNTLKNVLKIANET